MKKQPAVANITVFGIIALVAYPFLTHWLFSADTTMIGLFLETSIHETAQVAASGLIYDQTFDTITNPTAADVAMITKLVRNVLMAVVIPAMTFVYARRTGKPRILHKKDTRRLSGCCPYSSSVFLWLFSGPSVVLAFRVVVLPWACGMGNSGQVSPRG